jgi:hypothetical protein
VLAALYIGAAGPWKRWHIRADEDEQWWFSVAEIGLHNGDFDLGEGDDTSLAERESKRSRRASLRRAVDGLTRREYAESAKFVVQLDQLQRTYRSTYTPVRPAVMARITPDGANYVEQNRLGLVHELNDALLQRVLAKAGYTDVLRIEVPVRKRARRQRRSRPSPQRSAPLPLAAEGTSAARVATQFSRDQVVAMLLGEGHPQDMVLTHLRAWHREQQRESRQNFGEPGPPLREYLFDTSQIAELRSSLVGVRRDNR